MPRILKLFILPNAVFAALALLLAPAVLISGLNAVIMALATGVVVSFIVDAFKIITGRKAMGKAH